MKWKLLLLLTAVLLAGCDQAALEFAKQTGLLLKEYQTNINEQIVQETSYYGRDVDIARRSERRQLDDSLGAEREERSTELAADYVDGRKPVSLYRSDVRAYAQTEYESRKKSYVSAVDAALPYEQQLAKLEASRETVEALGKALEALRQGRNLKTEGADLKGFVAETKEDFSRMVCAELASNKGVPARQAPADPRDPRTADPAQRAAIARLRADRKCDDLEAAGK